MCILMELNLWLATQADKMSPSFLFGIARFDPAQRSKKIP